MSMYSTATLTTPEERADALASDLEWYNDLGPLPSLKDVVLPFVQIINMLSDLGDRAEAILPLAELRGQAPAAFALRDLLRDITDAMTVHASRATPSDHDRSGVSAAVRYLVEAITHVDDLNNWAIGDDVADIGWYGDRR